MERRLATVLFVDLVDSTDFVSTSDPEVVRRRVNQYFEHVSRCIQSHGGLVEKFAGDAVMAAFGIPQAHEDDAERALRSALSILESVHELGFEARIGVESGEVVVDEADSTFATGEAVNLAARLQQAAGPGEIMVGAGAYGLAFGTIELESVGTRRVRGRDEPVPVWRAVAVRDGDRPLSSLSAPLIGRDAELELLQNTFERAVRDRRAHLFTIYGDAGVGKSRLAREFVASLEGTTVLAGRSMPYGEGITYWPLAEMVKAAAGISDDDPVDEAHEKLLVSCEDEEVADLLGLAAGVLDAVEGERSQQEIAHAARKWAESLARAQPLVLAFEDIHWAEEPLLELIEHLSTWVRDAPLMIICLARPELLDVHSGWGGGRVRATAIELEPLVRHDSEELVDALLADTSLPAETRRDLLEKTEGNPLYVEETIRMLTEGRDDRRVRIPDTLQALIAARIDRLPSAAKTLLQRAAVIGRTFWEGALAHLAPDLDSLDEALDDLVLRDFLLRESRSSISGERAFRFKHVLIREVAYAGLSKSARADHHRRFAEWLRDRTGDELVEIRAYHLDNATSLLAELDGSAPPELVPETAAALTEAGMRALAREANGPARKHLLRAVELEPTLERRFKAALAAWRLDDLPAVSVEMERVREEASAAGEHRLEGRALTALAHITLSRDADLERATALGRQALAVLEPSDNVGRYDVLDVLANVGWWGGDLSSVERYADEMLGIAKRANRKDLESGAIMELANVYSARAEADRAEPLLARAIELAEESGSLTARAWAAKIAGELYARGNELDEAQKALEEARDLFAEAGTAKQVARVHNYLAFVAVHKGDLARAEKLLREAIRILKPLEDRGILVESQRQLSQVLLQQGRLEEAERYALESRQTVGPQDMSSRATTRLALALVRAAQGRDEEAETLFREALDILAETEFRHHELEPLKEFIQFLRERGRAEEAEPFEARLAEVAPAEVPAESAA